MQVSCISIELNCLVKILILWNTKKLPEVNTSLSLVLATVVSQEKDSCN